MATYRQKLVAQKITEDHRKSVSQAMLEAGYSPHTASKPSNLTQSNGWTELTKGWFQDEDVVRVHAEMLDAVCRKRYVFPLSMKDTDIKKVIECDDSFKVVYIERRKRQKVAHYLAPDNHTIIKAIDLYCRVTGKYALGRQIAKGKIAFDWGLRTRKNKPLAKSHLHRVLQNPLYYGCFWHGGELRVGSYETLITKRLFDDVQAVLKNKSKPKKIENDWAYAGLIKCGCSCGASVIFETKKKYYKGTDRWAEYTYARSSRRCSKCNQPGITLKELEQMIDEKLAPISIDEEAWRLGIELLNEKYEAEAKRRAQIVDSRQRQYQRLQGELDGYFKMRAREEMTADEFTIKKKNIIGEQARLKEKIDDGVNGQRTWLELAEDFFTTAYEARELLNSDNLVAKRKAVTKIGWNLLLKDKKLVWTYQEPYDILLKPTYRSDLRAVQDSNLSPVR